MSKRFMSFVYEFHIWKLILNITLAQKGLSIRIFITKLFKIAKKLKTNKMLTNKGSVK